jgi:ribosome production factor 1
MAFSKSATTATGFKPKNKLRRQAAFLSIKKNKESEKRDMRLRRKREEAKDTSLRDERLANNIPQTIEAKRVWDDEPVGDEEDMLGWAVDVERLAKRRKTEDEATAQDEEEGTLAKLKKLEKADKDNSDSDEESDSDAELRKSKRATSPTPSAATTSATNLELSPEFLKQKFPQIFAPVDEPKILITTSINSTLHKEADILTSFFPNSTYIRRTAHAHAHKYSVREIASFASAREYTALVVLMQAEHEKKPDGLDVIMLPQGPHFHFSVTNWIDGKKLPRHANDTGHYPELILNNFKTPLGILTAHLFKGLFPAAPELQGRQVLTLHNQRDYIFVRRHRYVFRDKRESEKSVMGNDGKPIKGVEDVKVGMQEIGYVLFPPTAFADIRDKERIWPANQAKQTPHDAQAAPHRPRHPVQERPGLAVEGPHGEEQDALQHVDGETARRRGGRRGDVGGLLLGYHDDGDDDDDRNKIDAKEAWRNINVNTNTPNQMLRNTRTYTHTIPYHTKTRPRGLNGRRDVIGNLVFHPPRESQPFACLLSPFPVAFIHLFCMYVTKDKKTPQTPEMPMFPEFLEFFESSQAQLNSTQLNSSHTHSFTPSLYFPYPPYPDPPGVIIPWPEGPGVEASPAGWFVGVLGPSTPWRALPGWNMMPPLRPWKASDWAPCAARTAAWAVALAGGPTPVRPHIWPFISSGICPSKMRLRSSQKTVPVSQASEPAVCALPMRWQPSSSARSWRPDFVPRLLRMLVADDPMTPRRTRLLACRQRYLTSRSRGKKTSTRRRYDSSSSGSGLELSILTR